MKSVFQLLVNMVVSCFFKLLSLGEIHNDPFPEFNTLSWSNLSKDVENPPTSTQVILFFKRKGNDLMTFCMINAIPLTGDYPKVKKNWSLIAQLNFGNPKKMRRRKFLSSLCAMHFFPILFKLFFDHNWAIWGRLLSAPRCAVFSPIERFSPWQSIITPINFFAKNFPPRFLTKFDF